MKSKMKKIILMLFTLLIVKIPDCPAQETAESVYFPLQSGNIWVYQYIVGIGGTERGRGFCKLNAGEQKPVNGKIYNLITLERIQVFGTEYCGNRLFYNGSYLRIDSISGNLYRNGGCGDESVVDSLLARRNDTARVCESSQLNVVCVDTSDQNVLGLLRKTKNFTRQTFSVYSTMMYAKDIGLVSSSYSETGYSCYIVLKGCVISGTLFGDTSTVTGITRINSEIPVSYSLFHNYPNPFNPVTKIKFQLPQKDFVNITVFDNSGKLVQALVNENLYSGTYECEFDGSNLASGVYFYRITTTRFSDVKKMILVK